MGKLKNMNPNAIRSELKRVGISQSGIARELKKSRTLISQVIAGNSVSHAVRTHIAKCIGKDVKDIWPETYVVHNGPSKQGRPIGLGLYDLQAAAA